MQYLFRQFQFLILVCFKNCLGQMVTALVWRWKPWKQTEAFEINIPILKALI